MGPQYELYTYYRSSCSARVRIAAHLKGIDLIYRFVHLLKREQHAEPYIRLNPSASVPTLVVTSNESGPVVISQSTAILEFLEEFETTSQPLLPPMSRPVDRARVREMVNIITCDTQPVTNLRILDRVEALGASKAEWARSLTMQSFAAYEALAVQHAGAYSFGDNVTLADVCLVPAIDGGLRIGVDMRKFPTILRVYTALQELLAFRQGSWRSQPDTPAELRPISEGQASCQIINWCAREGRM